MCVIANLTAITRINFHIHHRLCHVGKQQLSALGSARSVRVGVKGALSVQKVAFA